MTITFRRQLDLWSRIYLLTNGCLSLDSYMQPLSINLNASYEYVKRNHAEFKCESISKSFIYACLSQKKLDNLFGQALVFLFADDSSIKINGKLLLLLKNRLSKKNFDFLLKSTPNGHINLIPILAEYGYDLLIEQFKWHFFNKNFLIEEVISKRFQPKQIIMEIQDELSILDLEAYLDKAAKLIIPATQKLITNLTK